jgi:hypothetical protein
MISPFTKPGTKVVCIDASLTNAYNTRPCKLELDGLQLGATYTVDEIRPHALNKDGLIVVLQEIIRRNTPGYSLRRFRYAELPKSLTDLLNVSPVDSDVVARMADHPNLHLPATFAPAPSPTAGGGDPLLPPVFPSIRQR